MTKEEIIKEASNYILANNAGGIMAVQDAFIKGAEWANKIMINKACEWLEENLLDFWSQRITNTDYFIEDFHKAMEE